MLPYWLLEVSTHERRFMVDIGLLKFGLQISLLGMPEIWDAQLHRSYLDLKICYAVIPKSHIIFKLYQSDNSEKSEVIIIGNGPAGM